MRLGFALSSVGFVAFAACSAPSTDDSHSATGEPLDAATPNTQGHGGNAGASSMSAAGSSGTGGDSTTTSDASSSGAAGAAADSGPGPQLPDAAREGAAQASGFACTQVIGLVLTSEWYLAGFENGIDNARWQLKWAEHSYVDEWAKPASPFWDTPIVSPCAQETTMPDRVVFVSLSWTIKAQSEFETALNAVVANIKTKYPSVRTIDLLSIVRGPANAACDPNPNATESTQIPAGLDAAMAAVAARNPGFVSVGPKVEATACSDFTGVGPHLTSAGNMKMAQKYSAYYAKSP